jgi:shikimate dehydrogenase
MELYAVTGHPILHSRSPEIFRRLFQQHNLPAAYSRIKAATPEEALAIMNILGVSGLNVTAPLKEKLLPHLAKTDEIVKQIGSINLVKKVDSQFVGGNGDPAGILGPLATRGIQLHGKRILVVGAGGAARAAIFALTRAGAHVTITNRTYSRAKALAAEFVCQSIPLTQIRTCLADCDLLLSTIPAGADMIQQEWLKPETVVFDADYRQGSLAKKATAAGCHTIGGEEWLVQQALYSFRWFTGQAVSAGAAEVKVLSQLVLASEYKDKKNVALIGLMACGKSSIAKKLAELLNFTCFDSDSEIERLEGMTVATIFKQKGEAYFRNREKEMVARLAGMKGVVFASGGGAVLAAENRALLQQHAWTVWPVVNMEVTKSRLEPGTRPLLIGDWDCERLENLFQERKALYFKVSDIIVNGEKKLANLCEEIHEEIRFAL